MDRIRQLTSVHPVVIFSKTTCCMSHSIKILLADFGVNPTVYELDRMSGGRDIERSLPMLGSSSLPAVFIGGHLVGGADEIMTLHLNRTLVPMLRNAGAIWV